MSVIEKAFRAGAEAFETKSRWASVDDLWATFNPAKQMSTTAPWNALQDVLLAKGATQEWIDYALPDLHGAALQFSFEAWGLGFMHCEKGDPMPNPPEAVHGYWAWCPVAGEETWRTR